MSSDKVEIIAPASLANLGPGFDVFGIALKEPYDVIIAKRVSEPGIRIMEVTGVGAGRVALDAKRNTASVAAFEVLRKAKAEFGLELSIRKGVRPCSGMGSSGASAAGGAFAANLSLDKPLPMSELVVCAAMGEQASSGTLHADNVAPSLFGGFTIIRSYEPLDVVNVVPPANLGIVAALPDVMVSTKEARGILPKSVEMKKLVRTVGHASSMAVGMSLGDVSLIGRSVNDVIIEPVRAPLVPHLKEAEESALKAGAVASFLGGSGPCVAAFFDLALTDGKAIGEAVRHVYESKGIKVDVWVGGWGKGCRRRA
jgi:homoserine kinase